MVTSWTNPTPGTLDGTWASSASPLGLNPILDLIEVALQALELALGKDANDDATAIAARLAGVASMRRLVLAPNADQGALRLVGAADTGIINVLLIEDYLGAPIAWVQNAGGLGVNDRLSTFRNILGTPNFQADIYGYLRRNDGHASFVWPGPPGNLLSFADACQEGFEGSRSATLGSWQIPFGAGTIALHSESVGVTTPAGSFSSIRLTATGASLYAVTATGTSGIPVTAGVEYSVVGNVRRVGATARSVSWGIQWFDAGGVFISQAYGAAVATTQDAWVEIASGGLTAPGGAAYACVALEVATTAAGEAFDIGGIAPYRGVRTEFSPPFAGSGTYGTWGQAAAGDEWAHRTTGERWVCTTGGVPSAQVWASAHGGIGGDATPLLRGLEVVGNAEVRDSADAKSYRLRTSGSSLDFEGAGTSLFLSVWSGAGYTGTQRTYAVFESGSQNLQFIGQVQFRDGAFGTERHSISGAAAGNVVFNEDGAAADFRVEGDTDASLLFVDGSADFVGIGTNAPATKLDVNADSVRVRTAQTPASAAATGVQGEIAWDTDYLYVCVATDTWKRAALSTW